MSKPSLPRSRKSPAKPAAPERIQLPESVHKVILDHQGTLWQVKGIIMATLLAVRHAERDVDIGDVQSCLEAAHDLLEPVVMNTEPGAIAHDAKQMEQEALS